jgi:hypothetical protein
MGAFVFFSVGPEWLYPRDVSVRELQAYSSAYVGQGVNVVGYLVKHTAPHFGDDYSLCEGDPRNLYILSKLSSLDENELGGIPLWQERRKEGVERSDCVGRTALAQTGH